MKPFETVIWKEPNPKHHMDWYALDESLSRLNSCYIAYFMPLERELKGQFNRDRKTNWGCVPNHKSLFTCSTHCSYPYKVCTVAHSIQTIGTNYRWFHCITVVPPIDFHELSRCDIFSAAQMIVGQNSQKSMLACKLRNTTGCSTTSWHIFGILHFPYYVLWLYYVLWDAPISIFWPNHQSSFIFSLGIPRDWNMSLNAFIKAAAECVMILKCACVLTAVFTVLTCACVHTAVITVLKSARVPSLQWPREILEV